MVMSYVTPASLEALAVTFLVATTLLVTLRFVSRRVSSTSIGPDDIFTLIAWVLTVAMSIIIIYGVTVGLWGVPLPRFAEPVTTFEESQTTKLSAKQSQSLELSFIQTSIFNVQLATAKLAVVFFLRRVLCTPRRDWFHWATVTMVGILTVWGLLLTFEFIFQCGTHFSTEWEGPAVVADKACAPSNVGIIIESLDPLWDLVIFVLPMPRIFKLETSLSRRLAIAGIFVVGSASFAASLVRFAINTFILSGVHNSFTVANTNSSLSVELFWGMFEAGFAVVTLCLPSINPLFIKARMAVRSRLSSASRQSSGGVEYKGKKISLPHTRLESMESGRSRQESLESAV